MARPSPSLGTKLPNWWRIWGRRRPVDSSAAIARQSIPSTSAVTELRYLLNVMTPCTGPPSSAPRASDCIDVTTLAFGPDRASPAHDLTDSFTYNDHLQDVNLDGFTDLVTHFRVRDTGIACGDESVMRTGETLDGQPTEGTDSITTVGCRADRWPGIRTN